MIREAAIKGLEYIILHGMNKITQMYNTASSHTLVVFHVRTRRIRRGQPTLMVWLEEHSLA